jgi:hypothetical protein
MTGQARGTEVRRATPSGHHPVWNVRRAVATVTLGALLVSAGSAALAHGGGLNAEGCHTNRKTGDYHCHRAPAATSTPEGAPSRPQRPPESQVSRAYESPRGGPQCFVGPRGGTYTLTPSGRKNYNGC